MKILIVTPACHFGKIGGVQEDVYATITLIQSMGHEVAMYTVDSPQQSQEMLEYVRKTFGIEVKTFRPDLTKTGEWVQAFLREPSLFDRGAYPLELMSKDPAFREYTRGFDALMSLCSYSWPILKAGQELGVKTMLRSHNFEPGFFWDSIEFAGKFNPLNWLRRLAKYRSEYLGVIYSDAVGSLRFPELALYERWNPGAIREFTLAYLPPVVHGPREQKTEGPLDIFYLGASYNVSFNLRGAEALIRDIGPRVHAQAPGAFRFHICGGKLPAHLVAMCDGTSTIYEGYVEDLEGFLDKMDIGVFPVLTGRSTRGKIFGSICRAFPTIIPEIGASGFPLVEGEHVLYAETTDDFVRQILALRDKNVRTRLTTGSADFAEKNFSHAALTGQLQSMFDLFSAGKK